MVSKGLQRADSKAVNDHDTGEVEVVFTPSGVRGKIKEGLTALDAARDFGVDLDSVCGGRGICGRCQVMPSFGTFAKWGIESTESHVSPWSEVEADYGGKRPLEPSHRLGCALKLHGDVVIDVPESSQIHRQVIRKELGTATVGLPIDPTYTAHFLDLTEVATPHDLSQAMAEQWSLELHWPKQNVETDADNTVAASLTERLNELTEGTLVLRRDGETPTVAALLDGYVETIAGFAVDVGSTTLAAHLIDLSTGDVLASGGRMNPQIRFGEDLMSRVSYVMMNPGGDAELTRVVREGLDDLMADLVNQADITSDQVLDVVIVGNPVMHHLILGLDPTPLGQAPFELAIEEPYHTTAEALTLGLPNSAAYVVPCIAGHVGGDTVAAIQAEGPHRSDQIQLLVDVGTNAEIVLGNKDWLLAASSPTGPAFEGAQITHGQRATKGAIERVTIDVTTLEPRIRAIGDEHWSNEDGFDSQAVSGICGSGIIEALSEMVRVGLINQRGLIDGDLAGRTDRVVADGRTFSYRLHGDVFITQGDVRAIQLAKAALKAGIDLLMEHAGVGHVQEVRLAGAFGAHIDPVHAINLGLIPPCDPKTVSSVGNSAGVGAVRALLSRTERAEMESTVTRVKKIETAIEPRFQDLFVAALGFDNAVSSSSPEEPQQRRKNRRRSRGQGESPPGEAAEPRTQHSNSNREMEEPK